MLHDVQVGGSSALGCWGYLQVGVAGLHSEGLQVLDPALGRQKGTGPWADVRS